jgi:hypothetical protein
MKNWIGTWAFIIATFAALWPVMAHADVVAYSAPGNKHVFVESAPQIGAKSYLIKFTGITSPWADKVVKVEQTTTPSGSRYSFDYEIELSSGKIKRTYQILLDGEGTLVSGTIVPTVELYYSGGPRDGVEFAQDAALTQSSQNIGLAQQYQTAPYSPVVE